MKRSGFWWAATVGIAAGVFFAVERLRPSRRTREPGAGRVLRNLTIGMLAAATTAGSEAPFVAPVQQTAGRPDRARVFTARLHPLSLALAESSIAGVVALPCGAPCRSRPRHDDRCA